MMPSEELLKYLANEYTSKLLAVSSRNNTPPLGNMTLLWKGHQDGHLALHTLENDPHR